MLRDSMTMFEPFHLGRYTVLDELGRGAMGVVYKAHDTVIDRMVAVKTINVRDERFALSEAETLERFYREAKIAGRLTHPNITAIYDIGSEGGVHYFVMEYVEGDTVEASIERRETVPLMEKLRIIATTARTLHYAHMRGVIHRDIKPGNVMILNNRDPKIMDFGVARLQTGPLVDITERGKIFGTPHYMSPEQIKGAGVDHTTDIFSLGVMAYEFVTFHKPFDGESLKDVLEAVISRRPPPITRHDPSLPKELNNILATAMRKNRSNRFTFANQFADAVDLFISRLENERPNTEVGAITKEKRRIIKELKRNYLFFSDFEDEQIVEIFKLSSRVMFKAGEVIFKEGATGSKMFVIIDGKVTIVQRGDGDEEVELATLEEGDCFGEMAIIDNSPRSATAVAASDTAVVAINEIVLRVTRPELSLKLYRNLASVVAEKLRQSVSRLRLIEGQNSRLGRDGDS